MEKKRLRYKLLLDNEELLPIIISRPLYNEDGEIDPLASAEAEEAISRLPLVSERLAKDAEFLKHYYLTRHQIVSTFAKWAIRLHPYHWPPGLDIVCQYLYELLKPWD